MLDLNVLPCTNITLFLTHKFLGDMYAITGISNMATNPVYYIIYCRQEQFDEVLNHCSADDSQAVIHNLASLQTPDNGMLNVKNVEVQEDIITFEEPQNTLWSLLRDIIALNISFSDGDCKSSSSSLQFSMSTPNITISFKNEDTNTFYSKIIWSYDPSVEVTPIHLTGNELQLASLLAKYPDSISVDECGRYLADFATASSDWNNDFVTLGYPICEMCYDIYVKKLHSCLIEGFSIGQKFTKYVNNIIEPETTYIHSDTPREYADNISITCRVSKPVKSQLLSLLMEQKDAYVSLFNSCTSETDMLTKLVERLYPNTQINVYTKLMLQGLATCMSSSLTIKDHEFTNNMAQWTHSNLMYDLRIFTHKIILMDGEPMSFAVDLPAGGEIKVRRTINYAL